MPSPTARRSSACGGSRRGSSRALRRTAIRSTADSFRALERMSLPTEWRTSMSIIGWIILGLVAGFIGSKIVNKRGEGMMLDIELGIVGAIVGGILFSAFGAQGITGLNLWSMIVAVIGSVVVLMVYHAVMDRRSA